MSTQSFIYNRKSTFTFITNTVKQHEDQDQVKQSKTSRIHSNYFETNYVTCATAVPLQLHTEVRG